MKKLLVVFSLITLIFCGYLSANENSQPYLPYYDSPEFTPKWFKPNSEALKGFHKVSDFKFINQDGIYVSQKDFDNKIYVASFFFTSCPGICPKMRSQLSKVQEAFSDDRSVMIISHSIQPSADTVEILKDYADSNNIKSDKWQLITGNKDDIYTMAREDYFANEDLGEYISNEDFLHTENLVLVDSNKHIRGIYNGLNNTSVNYLIKDIMVLKKEFEK